MKRLRDRMREDLALRGMNVATIDSYVRCARKFAEHFGRSPCAMGMREVRAPGEPVARYASATSPSRHRPFARSSGEVSRVFSIARRFTSPMSAAFEARCRRDPPHQVVV